MNGDLKCPHRRFQLVIKLQADSRENVAELLAIIADQIENFSVGPSHHRHCDGGFYWDMREDPSMTKEKYFKSLEQYLKEKNESGETS